MASDAVTFTVEGQPIPKGRPRVLRTGRTYTPKRTLDWEATVRAAARRAMGDAEPFMVPVAVRLRFFMPRPKRLTRKADPEGAIPCDRRPDIDNLVKAVLDGLDVLWEDDGRVHLLSAGKWYAEKHGAARVEVEVRCMAWPEA